MCACVFVSRVATRDSWLCADHLFGLKGIENSGTQVHVWVSMHFVRLLLRTCDSGVRGGYGEVRWESGSFVSKTSEILRGYRGRL